ADGNEFHRHHGSEPQRNGSDDVLGHLGYATQREDTERGDERTDRSDQHSRNRQQRGQPQSELEERMTTVITVESRKVVRDWRTCHRESAQILNPQNSKRSKDMRRNIGKGSLSFLLVLCGLVLGSRASAQAQPPIITIDAPGATGGTVAMAINASGVIAGYYFASDGTHAFVRNTDGTFVSFDSPVGAGITPMSINNAGVITGFYGDPNFVSFGGYAVPRGFVRTPDGTFTTFDAPIDPS